MQNKYLIDTNVIIELLRGNSVVKARLQEVGVKNCAMSIITDYELSYGAWHAPAKYVEQELQKVRQIRARLPIARMPEAEKWGKAKQQLITAGNCIDDFDLIIAETAIEGGFIMVTDNVRHFSRVQGITIENWLE